MMSCSLLPTYKPYRLKTPKGFNVGSPGGEPRVKKQLMALLDVLAGFFVKIMPKHPSLKAEN